MMKDSKVVSSNMSQPNGQFNQPPPHKSTRASDLFPDPMHQFNPYMNPYMFPHLFQPQEKKDDMDDFLNKYTKMKQLENRLNKNRNKHHAIDSPMIGKYKAIKKMLNAVDDIHQEREKSSRGYRDVSTPGQKKYDSYHDVYRGSNNYKADSIYKTMFTNNVNDKNKAMRNEKIGDYDLDDLILSPSKKNYYY